MQRTLPFLIAVSLLGSSLHSDAAEESCNCKKFPYRPDPPCFAQCTALLLKSNTPGSLETILGVSPELAKKITAAAPAAEAGSFLSNLTSSERRELSYQLQSLNQVKVDQLTRSIPPEGSTERKVNKQYEVWASKDYQEKMIKEAASKEL